MIDNKIQVNHLKVGYEQIDVIDDISILIPDQKITTIIGPNGCGKSTLLKAMTRVIPHEKGNVLLDGESIFSMDTKELAKQMAILPQTPDNPMGITVAELVSYGRYPYQKGFGRLTQEDYETIDWALKLTDTMDYKFREVNTLSGGQRQRVWIAMALAQKTKVIFLDEPTTYLDIAHQLEILKLLQTLNQEQGYTIVMVLHDINQAIRFSDYLITMKDGDLVKQGSVEELINREMLAEIFSIDADIIIDPRTNKPVCVGYDLLDKNESSI